MNAAERSRSWKYIWTNKNTYIYLSVAIPSFYTLSRYQKKNGCTPFGYSNTSIHPFRNETMILFHSAAVYFYCFLSFICLFIILASKIPLLCEKPNITIVITENSKKIEHPKKWKKNTRPNIISGSTRVLGWRCRCCLYVRSMYLFYWHKQSIFGKTHKYLYAQRTTHSIRNQSDVPWLSLNAIADKPIRQHWKTSQCRFATQFVLIQNWKIFSLHSC